MLRILPIAVLLLLVGSLRAEDDAPESKTIPVLGHFDVVSPIHAHASWRLGRYKAKTPKKAIHLAEKEWRGDERFDTRKFYAEPSTTTVVIREKG